MRRALQIRRWWLVAIPGIFILIIWVLLLSGSNEPVYQGRRLGSWLRGHPSEYHPAVLAIGTNALPYLLAELQATDSTFSQWGKNTLGKISIGPFWRTASDRRYRAGLGLQILDTNSVPVLLNQVFATPMRISESDPSYAAANALRWMGSPAAQGQIKGRITKALHSSDPAERRNGCLAASLWSHPDFAARLVESSKETNATIRAAAVRAIIFTKWDTNLFLPALITCVGDEEAAVRRLAAEALAYQSTNVTAALPALIAAHAAESSRSNLRSDLESGYYDQSAYSAQAVRSAIESAIKSIDPKAVIPSVR